MVSGEIMVSNDATRSERSRRAAPTGQRRRQRRNRAARQNRDNRPNRATRRNRLPAPRPLPAAPVVSKFSFRDNTGTIIIGGGVQNN